MRRNISRKSRFVFFVIGGALLLAPLFSFSATDSSVLFQPVGLHSSYLQQHPRILFSDADREALTAKMKADPEIWQTAARRAAGVLKAPPSPDWIRDGRGYTGAELLFSGSLVYFLTGEEAYKDAVVRRLKAYAEVDTWGTGWRENLDIPCNWYMYYMSLAYDILFDEMSEEDRASVRDGLVQHARIVYEQWLTEYEPAAYDQNHTYVPLIALATAALALYDEVPEAERWLAFSHTIMERCRKTLSTDGYYYEGTSYWDYAFHWHLRWSDMMQRATGRDYYTLPIFRKNHLQLLHMYLPGPPYFFDVGDGGKGALDRSGPPPIMWLGRKHLIGRLASVFSDAGAQGVLDLMIEKCGYRRIPDDPAMMFLWHDPDLKGTLVTEQPMFHFFEDMGIVVWRSSWDEDATVCMFKAGPPLGYSAEKVMEELPGWTPNTGHVHPDMGAVWLFGRGAYLLTDTGYTAKKRTRDHNTFLVDGKGTGADYTYWTYRIGRTERDGYSKWAQVKLDKVHLEADYGYARGDLSAAYPDELGPIHLYRHVVMTKDFILLVDEAGGEQPHTFTSLLHTDREINLITPTHAETEVGTARLGIYVPAPEHAVLTAEPAIVFGGRGPVGGGDEQRGYQLSIQTEEPVKSTTYVTLLVPQVETETPLQGVSLKKRNKSSLSVLIHWGARQQTVTLDLNWKEGRGTEPVIFKND